MINGLSLLRGSPFTCVKEREKMPDIHGVFAAPEQSEIDAMEPRIKAFIFPSIPHFDYEIEAFNKAVITQIDHEKTIAQKMNDQNLPAGVKSFTIGNFSMAFEDGSFDNRITKRTICPTAYGILLEAGLLYKGVEGRFPGCYGSD